MYTNRARSLISAKLPAQGESVTDAMWWLFVAIGKFWQLTDDPEPYRLRFDAFMKSRVQLDSTYQSYYSNAADTIADLISERGEDGAMTAIFTDTTRLPGVDPSATEISLLRKYVSNEFINFRVALGGFKTWGAVNFRGYFGGANIEGQPVPYRVGE